jgi:hypothetical protein
MINPRKEFDNLFDRLRRNPADAESRVGLEDWLASHPREFEAMIPAGAMDFGIAPQQQPRRRQFLQNLLLQGYLPPRVEEHSGAPWTTETVNLGIITGYFYSHALSLLEAGLLRSDMAVLVAYPAPPGSEPWIERVPDGAGDRILFRRALMLELQGLVWRSFHEPVPVHYLMPIDNYYRSKFRLVTEYGDSGVPMPGSTLIREVCENKALLADAIRHVPGIRLAREVIFHRNDSRPRAAQLDTFCRDNNLRRLVTKPADGFGGIGVEFWNYPANRAALLTHVEQALGEHASILVQERIMPVPTRSGQEWNLRQYVLREGPDLVTAPWKRVRIGHGVVNTTRGARSTTVEHLLQDIDLDAPQQEHFLATLESTDGRAADVLRALRDYLYHAWGHEHRPYRGSGSNLDPDLLALDFMIGHDPGRPDAFAVYLNEINDFASGGMRDYEILRHRQMLPDAAQVRAAEPFSLAPAILRTAFWRGSAYRRAMLGAD